MARIVLADLPEGASLAYSDEKGWHGTADLVELAQLMEQAVRDEQHSQSPDWTVELAAKKVTGYVGGYIAEIVPPKDEDPPPEDAVW